MSVRDELRDLLLTNVGYKLVSLVFAVTLWIWVQNDQVITERATVALTWKLPEGLVAVEPLLPKAMVTVEGVQAMVRSLHQKELTLELDLSTGHAGELTVDLAHQPINGLPDAVRVTDFIPSTLTIQLDRELRRRLPVTVTQNGEPAAGYTLRSLRAEPPQIELVGPASILRGMETIATEPVDLAGLTEDMDLKIGLELRRGMKVSSKGGITVKVDIEQTLGVRRLESVPVVVGDPRYTSVLENVAVVLAGPTEVLSKLDPADVRVMVVIPADLDARPVEVAAGTEGLHYVVERGGGDQVDVQSVEPARIPLSLKVEDGPTP